MAPGKMLAGWPRFGGRAVWPLPFPGVCQCRTRVPCAALVLNRPRVTIVLHDCDRTPERKRLTSGSVEVKVGTHRRRK